MKSTNNSIPQPSHRPDTTRPIRTGEVAGREYLFVSRDKMDADIGAGKFIENGEYKGHLYGTSTESVRAIFNAGCVCVLAPHYQAIKTLRTPQLKPYIVHVKPPPTFERLKASRTATRARSTFDETNSRGFTVRMLRTRERERRTNCTATDLWCRIPKQDEELREMIKSSERIDFLYGHFFDEDIVNDDLAAAFEQLVLAAERADSEPLWAPSSWVQ